MERKFTARSWIGGAIQVLMFPLILFLGAGTLAWPAGWIFLLMLSIFVIMTVRFLNKRNPGLLEERMSVFKSSPGSRDRNFLPLFVVSTLWLILMPLDAVRFHWSHLPLWVQVVGMLVLGASFILIYQAFRENAYLTPTVRIQQERGQQVVSTGLYRYVRHPMYTGFHLFFLGVALLLGSVVGLLLAIVLVLLFFRRAVLEEELLRKELPGYDLYMARVHSRFIPHLW